MSSWRVRFAFLIGIGPASLAGSARAAEVGGAPQVVTTPRVERWARLELGLRTGFGIPFGEVTREDGDLNDLISAQIPIWVDLGARIDGHVSFGLYYSTDSGSSAATCAKRATCSGLTLLARPSTCRATCATTG